MNRIANRRALAGAFALTAALALMASGSARAELVVIDQTGTGYKADQKLGDDTALDVPAGGRVKLKRLPDGANVEVKGPHKGPLATYKTGSDCNWWNPLCKKTNTDTNAATGATRGVTPAPGATRGAAPAPAPIPAEGGTRGVK
jgi:hypothetical protein